MSAEAQKLHCLDVKLGNIQRLLQAALGAEAQPINASIVEHLRASGGEAEQLDFLGALGKPASTLTLTNLGATDARLFFETVEQQAEQSKRIGPVHILPGAVRTFSRQVEVLEVAQTGSAEAWVQVEAL